MEKGWEQVVAVYGILFAGAAYLPIDIHNPKERVEKILRDSGTRIILVQNQADDHDAEWLRKWNCVSLSGLKNETEIKMQENKARRSCLCNLYVWNDRDAEGSND